MRESRSTSGFRRRSSEISWKEQELVDYFAKHPSSPKYPTPYETPKRLADYYSYAADQTSAKALVQDKLAATARHDAQTQARGSERQTKRQ
jgi:hypothetical protein